MRKAPHKKESEENDESKKINDSEKFDEEIERDFTETIWKNGKKVGYAKGIIELKKIPFLRQMLIGVRSGEGIKNSFSNLMNRASSINSPSKEDELSIPFEIKEITSLKDQLFEYINDPSKFQYKQILFILKECSNILKKTSQQMVIIY